MRGGSPDQVRLSLIAEVRALRFVVSSSGLAEQNAALIAEISRLRDRPHSEMQRAFDEWFNDMLRQQEAELRASRKVVEAAREHLAADDRTMTDTGTTGPNNLRSDLAELDRGT